nr:MAG TPA: hypothetical protein [Caudoviricetes sp.]DAY70680.1 MAG TPA: hypothetical protein [Caudoviricetes sp.]
MCFQKRLHDISRPLKRQRLQLLMLKRHFMGLWPPARSQPLNSMPLLRLPSRTPVPRNRPRRI